jgi:hypothetical protein
MHGPCRAVEAKFPHFTPRDCYVDDQFHVYTNCSFLFEWRLVHDLRSLSLPRIEFQWLIPSLRELLWGHACSVPSCVDVNRYYSISRSIIQQICQNLGAYRSDSKEQTQPPEFGSPVDVHRRFVGTHFFHLHDLKINQVINQQVWGVRERERAVFRLFLAAPLFVLLFESEDGSSKFGWNVSEFVPECTMSHFKRWDNIKCYQKSLILRNILQKLETFHITLLKIIRVNVSTFTNTSPWRHVGKGVVRSRPQQHYLRGSSLATTEGY